MQNDGGDKNIDIARRVYAYILVIGAASLMSTDRFSFDVFNDKNVGWYTYLLFWMTMGMFGWAFYFYDYSMRNHFIYSIFMSLLFVAVFVFPIYVTNDPRVLILRLLIGSMVLFSFNWMYGMVKRFRKYDVNGSRGTKTERHADRRKVNRFVRSSKLSVADDSGVDYSERVYGRFDERLVDGGVNERLVDSGVDERVLDSGVSSVVEDVTQPDLGDVLTEEEISALLGSLDILKQRSLSDTLRDYRERKLNGKRIHIVNRRDTRVLYKKVDYKKGEPD